MDELKGEVDGLQKDLQKMDDAYKHWIDPRIPSHLGLIVAEFDEGRDKEIVVNEVRTLYGFNDLVDYGKGVIIQGTLTTKVTAVGGEVNFPKGEVRSPRIKVALVLLSVTLMLALYIASLGDADWEVSLAWIFVVVGYGGLLVAVCIYAETIKHRIETTTVALGPHGSGSTYCALQNGNIDKDGTFGYALPVSKLGGVDVVKISTLRAPSVVAQLCGTMAGCAFLAAFLLHYLGLRSVQWWVCICELAILFDDGRRSYIDCPFTPNFSFRASIYMIPTSDPWA